MNNIFITALTVALSVVRGDSGWGHVTRGNPADIKQEKNVFGLNRKWLALHNRPGQVYQIDLPVAWPQNGKINIIFSFGISKESNAEKLFALVNICGISDLRLSRQVYLLDKKQQAGKTVLAVYNPGQVMTIRLLYDVSDRKLEMVYINDHEVKGFKPLLWLVDKPGNIIKFYGPTESGTTVYFSEPQITEAASEKKPAPWLDRPAYIPPSSAPGAGIYKAAGKFSGKLAEIDRQRLHNITIEANIYFSAAQIKQLPDILKEDQLAASYWSKQQKYISKIVRDRGLGGQIKDPVRYTYSLGANLSRLALYYLVTGDKEVGKVLRALMLDTAKRPAEFWIHHHLRQFDKSYPVGALETAMLTKHVATAFIWSRDLYSDQESDLIKNALRYKGLYPCMRWLENSRRNGWGASNWLAVLSAGALAGSRVLGENHAEEIALKGLSHWLRLVEDDGSYSEPLVYFDYGLSSFIDGVLILGPDKAKDIVRNSQLRKSMSYLLYNYSGAKPDYLPARSFQINFGDGDLLSPPNQTVFMFLAYAFDQGAGIWMAEHFPTRGEGYSYSSFLMRIMFNGKKIKPVAPAELHLPLAKTFVNGVGYIRSGWDMKNDTIMALRGGAGGKTKYTHDRPNRNAIILIAKGDYLLAAPGRASYRSPLHYGWDQHAASHNTITFYGDNQTEKPVADIPTCGIAQSALSLICDAAAAYRPEYRPTQVLRSILYIRDPGYFIVRDTINSPRSQCPVDINYYFANWDDHARLQKVTSDICNLIRPGVIMKTGIWSNRKLQATFGTGYMHTNYCYFPGDPGEGKKGSSLLWRMTTAASQKKVEFYSFISVEKLDVTFDNPKSIMTVKNKNFTDIISFKPQETVVTRQNVWTISLNKQGKLIESSKL